MLKKAKVLFASIKDSPFQCEWKSFLHSLPNELQNNCLKYHRIEDQMKHTLGLYLVKKAYSSCFNEELNLLNYKKDRYNKPYLLDKPNFYFNLSYSGEVAICACNSQPIGIDIELNYREIELELFEKFFSKQSWLNIKKAQHPFEQFYLEWTLVEATMKAIGLGIPGPVKEIYYDNKTICISGQSFFYSDLKTISGYTTHVCSASLENPQIEKILFDNL